MALLLCWRNERSGSYFTSSVFVFEIACFSISTGFSWDHQGIFATLSSRLVKKIPGHKYYFVRTMHKRDIGLNSGTVLAKLGHLATMSYVAQGINDVTRAEPECNISPRAT